MSKTWPPETLQDRTVVAMEGAQGAQGARGPQGLPGTPGKPGFDSRYVSIAASTLIQEGQLVAIASGKLIVNTASLNCIGVATHIAGANQMVQVQVAGIAKCIAGAATTSGSLAASTAAGKVINHSSGSSIGVVLLAGGSDGAETTIIIRPEDA